MSKKDFVSALGAGAVNNPEGVPSKKPEIQSSTSYTFPVHFTVSEDQQDMLDALVSHYRRMKSQGKMASYSKASVMRDALEAHYCNLIKDNRQ